MLYESFSKTKQMQLFYSNISSLKTAVEEERTKLLEEFILKARKSFRRRIDTIIENNGGHNE